jgi:hypothetical protein
MRIAFWLNTLSVERLASKTQSIRELLNITNNSWEEAFYIQLAISFGLKINTLPFELLARSLPLKVFRQQPADIFRAEALLFGQAGFLEEEPADAYQEALKKEYSYHKTKYKLTPIENHLWKFMRLRPLNFPTVRIAQLANLLSKQQKLFSYLMSVKDIQAMIDFLSCDVSEYWTHHYQFGKISPTQSKKLGKSSVYLILINSVIPFMFLYANNKNKPQLREHALSLLEQIPPEQNAVINQWEKIGVKARHASDSQALLELSHTYCKARKCLDCQIGHLILKANYQ